MYETSEIGKVPFFLKQNQNRKGLYKQVSYKCVNW